MPAMPNATQKFTFAQLEALWINNGGDRASAPVMAAIALAESSGIPTNVNRTDNNGKQTSWGLWQISNGTHNMPRANILDPNVNAQAAVAKKKSQGLGAWGTYTSGAYRKYLKNGVDPDNNGLPTGSTPTANQAGLSDDIGGAIGEGLGNAFKALMQPIISTLIWGGEIMFGLIMVGLGIIAFVMNTDPAKEAINKIEEQPPVPVPVSPAIQAAREAHIKEMKIQREQARQTERKAIRQEAAKRNKENDKRSTGNSKS